MKFSAIYIWLLCVFIGVQESVQINPEITFATTPTVGFIIRLNCNTSNFNSDNDLMENATDPNITWHVNGKEVTNNTKYTVTGSVLQFTVQKTDRSNHYLCQAEDGSQKNQSKDVTFQPRYPATISGRNTYQCNGTQNITLQFEADGNPSVFSFGQWRHIVNGVEIRQLNGINIGNMSYLHLNHCSYQDEGNYFLSVQNNVSFPNHTKMSSASTFLTVKDTPYIIGDRVVNSTDEYNILIMYHSFEEAEEVRLYRNNIELRINQKSSAFSLPTLSYKQTIVPINGIVLVFSVTRTGNYIYSIQNSYGTTSKEIDVWSDKTQSVQATTSQECFFTSLEFNIQIVIIVTSGVTVVLIVLIIAEVAVRCHGKSAGEKAKSTEKRVTTISHKYYQDGDNDISKENGTPKEKNGPENFYEDVDDKKRGPRYDALKRNGNTCKTGEKAKSTDKRVTTISQKYEDISDKDLSEAGEKAKSTDKRETTISQKYEDISDKDLSKAGEKANSTDKRVTTISQKYEDISDKDLSEENGTPKEKNGPENFYEDVAVNNRRPQDDALKRNRNICKMGDKEDKDKMETVELTRILSYTDNPPDPLTRKIKCEEQSLDNYRKLNETTPDTECVVSKSDGNKDRKISQCYVNLKY